MTPGTHIYTDGLLHMLNLTHLSAAEEWEGWEGGRVPNDDVVDDDDL